MQIFEIFRSIQGETSRAGLPMWFIRLAGCDLACSYCDTASARDMKAGRAMTVAEVVAAVGGGRFDANTVAPSNALLFESRLNKARPNESRLNEAGLNEWVAITGGEPMLQLDDVNALVAALIERGRRVLVETSGAHPIDRLDGRAVRIVDVKTPGSGMADRMCWANLRVLGPHDEVKFVLTGRADYDWAKDVLGRYGLLGRAEVLFSPAAPGLDPRTLAGWILADALPVRLNLQLHKLLGMR
jgi:7-carboxy-7-deazaguanine synthase